MGGGGAPAADLLEGVDVVDGRHHPLVAAQHPEDVVVHQLQGVQAPLGRAAGQVVQQALRQGGRVCQALQHRVHEAGVAHVLQSRPLRAHGRL